ncbi:cell wall-binding repeat-containing protein [Catenulispora acidiphila]|uniref:cell wall-binding repeat-containing protein n=1 Tax=Catenulispora acidiphila TaxID=304895 RepID=UPI00167FE0AC|nr:cell wall-binding repeat-containing protein [Catenulispora acidiphila]
MGVASAPAHAAAPTTIYVDNGSAACSDTGSGTQDQPFCTINAAAKSAAPDDTVLIEPGTGHYSEPMMNIQTSGTPGHPITYQAAQGTFTMGNVNSPGQYDAAYGLRFDQTVHDIVIQGFHFGGGLWVDEESARFQVRNNFFDGSGLAMYDGEAMEVTGNTFTNAPLSVEGAMGGISEPTPTLVDHNTVVGGSIWADMGSTTVTHNTVSGSSTFGILAGTNKSSSMWDAQVTIAGNLVYGNAGGGISAANWGATITGNTIADNGGNQVEIHSPTPIPYTPPSPPQTHVENNIIATGTTLPHSAAATASQIGITVDQAAWATTFVDRNVVSLAQGRPYEIGTTIVPDGAHLAALGHGGTAEINAAPLLNADGTLRAGSPAVDSADSAAAGEQATDLAGNTRHDDSGVCDTGAGSRSYDDRGAFEFQGTTSPAVACAAPTAPVPAAPAPTVDSVDFPATGGYFGVGRAGYFHVADHSGARNPIQFSVDGGVAQQLLADASGSLMIPYTATTAGPHWIDVQVVGASPSLTTRYTFTVPATDTVVAPTAYFTVAGDRANPKSVTVNAIKSLHGTTPIQSFTYHFGDGTSTGPTSATSATHIYSTADKFPITVTVQDTDSLSNSMQATYDASTGQTSTPKPSPNTIHVNNAAGANCSDAAGSGSASKPFCTIAAAAALTNPGDTVLVSAGTYASGVDITRSGTPGDPITYTTSGTVDLVSPSNAAYMGTAFTLSGVHDVTVHGFVMDTKGSNGVLVGNSQNVEISGNTINDDGVFGASTYEGVQFTNVTDSAIVDNTVNAGDIQGIVVDSGSLRAAIQGNTVRATRNVVYYTMIQDAAPNSTVVGNRVSNPESRDIAISSGADGTVVAGNMATCSNVGISVDANNVAVTANTVMQTAGRELAVGGNGNVTGTSIRDNVFAIPDNTFDCGSPNDGSIGMYGVDIYAGSTAGTTLDHNDVWFPLYGPGYQWGDTEYAVTTPAQLAAFTTATGQSAHDTVAWPMLDANGAPRPGSPTIDAADSSATGYPDKDLLGNPRVDDSTTPNTGLGPIAYGDMGAVEYQPQAPGGGTPTPTPTPTPPPTPTPAPVPNPGTGQPTVQRLGGGTRYATGLMVSQHQWAAGKASAVVLARGDAAPDALAGVPFAAHVHGPLLLTDPSALDSETRSEIDRVLGGPHSGKTVYILGGAGAVAPSIEKGLRDAGYKVVRYGGDSRFSTALQIASAFGPTDHVIVATGRNFPDALSAGSLGAAEGAPIVLSDDTVLDAATAAFVARHPAIDPVGVQAQHAVAGLAAGRTVDRSLAGSDRYVTATDVATRVAQILGHTPATVGVASGTAFPDALTGGAFIANAGGALVLTDPTRLTASTGALLTGWHGGLSTIEVFGGPLAVSGPTYDAIVKTVGARS